jgi:hypothetical protein
MCLYAPFKCGRGGGEEGEDGGRWGEMEGNGGMLTLWQSGDTAVLTLRAEERGGVSERVGSFLRCISSFKNKKW